ncbi:MAG: solute-binding protein, partial [Actinomycetia bacterium]|nr:solute-binding protein [Actinomycetes bacterium]
SVRALATKIQLGEVDAGLVYRTDANALMLDTIAVPGLDQHLNEYLVALIGDQPNEGARAFVELLVGPAGHTILSDLGFEPA